MYAADWRGQGRAWPRGAPCDGRFWGPHGLPATTGSEQHRTNRAGGLSRGVFAAVRTWVGAAAALSSRQWGRTRLLHQTRVLVFLVGHKVCGRIWVLRSEGPEIFPLLHRIGFRRAADRCFARRSAGFADLIEDARDHGALGDESNQLPGAVAASAAQRGGIKDAGDQVLPTLGRRVMRRWIALQGARCWRSGRVAGGWLRPRMDADGGVERESSHMVPAYPSHHRQRQTQVKRGPFQLAQTGDISRLH